MMRKVLLALLLMVSMPVLAQYPLGSGPEPAMAYSDSGLPTHTIYRPQVLNGSYPVVLWANGSCRNSNLGYREFLSEVASQGFIVLAIGPFRDTPPPPLQRPDDPDQWPPFETDASLMLFALDWISTENRRSGSPFEGHADIGNVAVMGHSCGGLQSLVSSSDPRITTTLVLNSGMMPDGDSYMILHGAERAMLQELHAPVAYFIGGQTDIAYPNAEMDWQDLQAVDIPVINANMDVGHGATYRQQGGYPFAQGPLAWLKYQLKNDEDAAAMFLGARCGLCQSRDWTLKRHNL